MAFTVEDGTIVADANALTTVEFVDAYHLERGNAGWTGTTTAKQQAIVRATDYTEQRWAARYIGNIVDDDQVLSWPRDDVTDRQGREIANDSVPLKIQQAVAEYALKALTTTLFNEVTPNEDGLRVVETKDKVGPIEQHVRYAENQSVSVLKPWPAADRLVAEFITSLNTVIRA